MHSAHFVLNISTSSKSVRPFNPWSGSGCGKHPSGPVVTDGGIPGPGWVSHGTGVGAVSMVGVVLSYRRISSIRSGPFSHLVGHGVGTVEVNGAAQQEWGNTREFIWHSLDRVIRLFNACKRWTQLIWYWFLALMLDIKGRRAFDCC